MDAERIGVNDDLDTDAEAAFHVSAPGYREYSAVGLHFRGLSPGARHSDRDETNRDSTLRVTPIEVSSR